MDDLQVFVLLQHTYGGTVHHASKHHRERTRSVARGKLWVEECEPSEGWLLWNQKPSLLCKVLHIVDSHG